MTPAVNLQALPTFARDGVFHVVVESPRGSAVKFKYDPQLQAMTISRPLVLGVTYPFDWGFVPSTRGPDGDALDALVIWDAAAYPGVVLPCRAIGLMQVEQNRTAHDRSERIRNDRVLAVPDAARRESNMVSAETLPPRVRQECEQFAMMATALEGKDVRVLGWSGPDEALALIARCACGAG